MGVELFSSCDNYTVEYNREQYSVIFDTDHNADYTNITVMDDNGDIVDKELHEEIVQFTQSQI